MMASLYDAVPSLKMGHRTKDVISCRMGIWGGLGGMRVNVVGAGDDF